MDEKMILAEKYSPDFGVNATLAALGLSKGTWHYRRRVCQSYTQKHADLKEPLMKVAREHPAYGYRKVTTELNEAGYEVNHKVIQRLQKEWDLAVVRCVRPQKQSALRNVISQVGSRANLVAGLDEFPVLGVLYTDFTELAFDRGQQKSFLMPLLDHTSKLAVGWAVGSAANTTLALEAWKRSRNRLLRLGLSLEGIIVHHDQDPVYTGHAWLAKLCLEDGVRVSYSLNGAKGNTCMESFNGHFKRENTSILWEQRDLPGVVKAVESRMNYYNDVRRHETLNNLSPRNYLKKNGY